MKFDISVIVLTYFPNKEKLLSTIKSILLQKNISHEILIADDGSNTFFKEDIEKLMDEYNFTNYKFVEHSQNQGTVINFYDAVKLSNGEIVKPISPGDYLYSEYTLQRVCEFMKKQNADATFGNLIYYADDGGIKVFDKKDPINDKVYLDYENYNSRKIAKHLIKFSDAICGASLFYKTSVLKEFLSQVIGTLIYAEDAITQYFALEGKKILKIRDFVVFYEYGSGISTSQPSGSNRIMDDFIRFYDFLMDKFPKEKYLKNVIKRLDLISKKKRICYYLYRLLLLDNNYNSIKNKIISNKYKCVDYDLDFFNKINCN